ncbi:hypothetical protein BC827DRAFT_1159038 [Russula dissimulans]|nr:hypothetical protein BC827DRAFT_1159038 [Russula dissimulans]
MGVTVISRRANVLSSKFVFLPNLGTVKVDTAFKVKMVINNLEAIDSLESTKMLDPNVFAFFKGRSRPWHNTASTHQLLPVGVARHGSLEDQVYLQMAMVPMARAANLLLTITHSSGAPGRPPLPLAAIPEGKKPAAMAGNNAGEAATTTSSVQARSDSRRAFEIRQTLLLATPACL